MSDLLRRRWWLLLLASVGLVFVGAITVELLQIRRDLDAGRDQLAHLDLIRVDQRGGLAGVVGDAADRIDAADHRARTSPVLRALSIVPWVGDQVDTVRELTGVATTIADQGRIAATNIQTALDEGSGPAARIEIVRRAGEEIDTLRQVIDDIDLDTRSWLVPPLHQARHDLDRELREASTSLEEGVGLTHALEAFLTGPRRYLILGGNNAEMRAVGIPTTSGVATIENGSVTVGEFSAANDYIEIPEPGVPVEPGYEAMYGWLNANRGYRTALASPNWPYAAEVADDITTYNIYRGVDGIIYVDTFTLALLLGVVGPVDVAGETYFPFDAAYKLLHENYLEYESITESDERRAVQSQVAQAIFTALNERDYSITRLAGILSQAARGRHILGWSRDPAENELWASFGAGGELPEDGLVVVSEDLGASKLDFYVTMDVDLETERHDDRIDVTMDITVTNPEHTTTSPYIDGGSIYAEPGEYGSYLVVSIPSYAFHLANADPGFSFSGAEAPLHSAGMIFRVPEGDERTVTVTFSLPPDAFSLSIVPSARLQPTTWNYEGEEFDDSVPVELDLHSERVVTDDEEIQIREPAEE